MVQGNILQQIGVLPQVSRSNLFFIIYISNGGCKSPYRKYYLFLFNSSLIFEHHLLRIIMSDALFAHWLEPPFGVMQMDTTTPYEIKPCSNIIESYFLQGLDSYLSFTNDLWGGGPHKSTVFFYATRFYMLHSYYFDFLHIYYYCE